MRITAAEHPAPRRSDDAGQMAFDWQIGHARPWLWVSEIARSLRCSKDHVANLIAGGDLDCAIDIRADDASRPCYRVLRASFDRFVSISSGENRELTAFEEVVNGYLNRGSAILAAWQAAMHLRCTDSHILSLAHYFTDISAGEERRYLRIHRAALLKFIINRRIQ